MFTIGCCRKIIVTLRNNVYNKHSPKEGEYRLVRNKINGKNLWISADRNNAIWYFPDRSRNGGEWGIGLMDAIGSNLVELGTRGNLDTQCPSNRDTWQFLDLKFVSPKFITTYRNVTNYFGKWKFAGNGNDVQIQCKQLRYPWDIFGVLGYKPVQQQSYFPPAPAPPLPHPVENTCNCGSNGGWSTTIVNPPNHSPQNHSPPQNSNPQNNHSPQNPNPTSINIPPQIQNGNNNNYRPQGQTGIIDAKSVNINGFEPSIQYQTSASSNRNQVEKNTPQTIQNCVQKNLTEEKRNEIAEYFLTRLFYGILKGLRKKGFSLSKPGNNVPINYISIEKDIGNIPKPEIPGKPGSSFEAELLRSLEESLEEIEVPGVSEEQAKDLAKYFLPKFLEKVPDNFIPTIELLYPLHVPQPQVHTTFIDVKAADDLANLGRSNNVSLKENSNIGNGNQNNFRPAQEYTPASSPIYYTPQIESSKNREARLHLINGPPYYMIEKQPFNLIPDIEKLVVQDTVRQNVMFALKKNFFEHYFFYFSGHYWTEY